MGSFCWAGMPNLPAIQFAFTFVLFNIVVSRFENYRNQAQDFSNLSISRALEESVKKVRRLFPKAHHIKKRIFYPLFVVIIAFSEFEKLILFVTLIFY